MKNNIRLYIGGKEVQFKTEPEIFYNYTETDLQNPTIVKNSYSKTITIEGTPENNKIFGQFWDLERTQSDSSFNPSQKTPFVLYVNGEICESGYAKLDEIVRKKEVSEYKITLYGGLGEFFYLLSFNDNGDKLKLSDLEYTTQGGDNEFNFTINKETVEEAWESLSTNANNKWKYINFAPAYNGNPQGLSADKVLINFNDNILESSIESGGTTYSARQGYAIGTLPAEVDEWVVRDLRSWNQRPVIRMREIIRACERYAAKSGYTIDYDTDFFKEDSPYWRDSWVTLPKFDEIKIQGASDESTYSFNPTAGSVMTYNGWYDSTIMMRLEDIPIGTSQITLDIQPVIPATAYSQTQLAPISGNTLYSSSYINGAKNFNGFLLQLLAYDGTDFNSNLVAASDAVFITSKVGEEYLDIRDNGDMGYVRLNKNYSNVFGTFLPQGDGTYKFSEEVSLTLDNTNKAQSYALRVLCIANLENITTYGGSQAVTYGYRRGQFYTNTHLNSLIDSGSSINTVHLATDRDYIYEYATGNTFGEIETAGYTGAKITKKLLLDTEATPCDYLLSYAKIFGLYFFKNPYDKVIHIMTRGNFYRTNNLINIEDKIERKDNFKINPITFNAKWYDMQFDNVEGESAKKYKTTYGRNYGIQRINTGYNFDNNSVNLLENNVFKGAVECTDKSRYYVAPCDYDYYYNIPYYYNQGMTYALFDSEGNTTDVTPTNYPISALPMKSRKYYDAFSKVELRDTGYKAIDGQNVLLFYNGMVEHQNDNNKTIVYYLTDDLGIMGQLNDGQSCWISTESEYSSGGTQIAIEKESLPDFGRYIDRDNYLLGSFDFGSPKELFIPDAVLKDNSSIYYNYWKDYITDLYDVNTKVVECQVLLEGKPSMEWLRDFYWFDNSIWRINKITDWKIGSDDLTKVEFIKVQDRANYELNAQDIAQPITLSASRTHIPLSGGTVTFYVDTEADVKWFSTNAWEPFTEPFSGTGSSSFTVRFPAFTGGESVDIALSLVGEQGQYSNTLRIYSDREIEIELVQPLSGVINPSGDTVIVNVRSVSPWTGTCNGDYGVYVISGGTGNNEWQRFEYRVSPNTGAISRTMKFGFSDGFSSDFTNNMTQDVLYHLDAVAEPITFAASGGTGTISITADTNWEIEMEAMWGGVLYPDFLTLSQSAGTGNAVVTVTCPETDMTTARQEYIYIKHNGVTLKTLFMSQYGSAYMTITPDEQIEYRTSDSGTTYTRQLDTNVEDLKIDFDSTYVYDCKIDGVAIENLSTIPTGQHTYTFKIYTEALEVGFRTLAVNFYKRLPDEVIGYGTIWIKHNE